MDCKAQSTHRFLCLLHNHYRDHSQSFHDLGAIPSYILRPSSVSLNYHPINGCLANSDQAGLALVWDFSEAICLCLRSGHKGIHPGANVALDLLLWLAYLISTVMLAILGYASDARYSSDYYNDGYYDDYIDGDVQLNVALCQTAIAFGALEMYMPPYCRTRYSYLANA